MALHVRQRARSQIRSCVLTSLPRHIACKSHSLAPHPYCFHVVAPFTPGHAIGSHLLATFDARRPLLSTPSVATMHRISLSTVPRLTLDSRVSVTLCSHVNLRTHGAPSVRISYRQHFNAMPAACHLARAYVRKGVAVRDYITFIVMSLILTYADSTHTGRPGQGVKSTPLRDSRQSDAKFAKVL
eukprot:1520781-Amphidinium_carterae.1